MDNIETQLLRTLAAHGLIVNRAGWAIAPITGGLNSRVYVARTKGGPPALILRLPKPENGWLLRREERVLGDLSTGCECVPPPVALVEDAKVPGGLLLIHGYVPGAPRALQAVTDAALFALAGCLAAIHANHRDRYETWPWLKPLAGARAAAFHDRLAAMERYATFSEGLGQDLQRRAGAVYTTLASTTLPDEAGWNETGFAQLHGDLSIGNIIWDGDAVQLIDWEFTRAGDPAEELAYLFTEQPMPAEAVTAFHQHYIAAGGDPSAITRATCYAPLAALDSTYWWGDYLLRNGGELSTAPEILAQLERAEAAMGHFQPGS